MAVILRLNTNTHTYACMKNRIEKYCMGVGKIHSWNRQLMSHNKLRLAKPGILTFRISISFLQNQSIEFHSKINKMLVLQDELMIIMNTISKGPECEKK